MIYLDLDGVLVDFRGDSMRLHGLDPETCDSEYRFWLSKGMTSKQFFATVDEAGEQFWANMSEYPWTEELIEMVNWYALSARTEVAILSSPTNDPSSLSGKVRWMQKRFGETFRDYLLVPAHHKKHLAPDNVLIDDFQENYHDWNFNHGYGILFPQPWNGSPHIDRRLAHVEQRLQEFIRRSG